MTVEIMFFTWVVQTPISLLLGIFTAGRQRYRAALAVLYFVPLLLSSAAVAIAFKALLDPNFGLGAGLTCRSSPRTGWAIHPGLAVVVFVIAWQFIPFHTLIYQGGVRQIPASMYEAAQIDGAGRVRQFFTITLPQLKYTIITSSTLMLVGSLTYFDLIFVLTGAARVRHPNAGPAHVHHRFPGQPDGRRQCHRRHPRRYRPRTRPAAAATRWQNQRKPIGRCLMAT